MFELRRLTLNDEQAFLEGYRLFSDMDPHWFSFTYREGMNYADHLKELDDEVHGRNLRPERVPHTMLYAFLDGKIIGRSSIRHELNDHLRLLGGHIGFAVATAYRNRGFASLILKMSLDYCREILHLEKVLVTCDDDNLGSMKTILKNGGVLEDKILNEGKTSYTNRYWIKL